MFLNILSLIFAFPSIHIDTQIVGIQPVIYTNSWYIPDYLEIPKGTMILFFNMSGYPMWTASDPHPVHTDYDIFDAKKAIQSGAIYAFKFSDIGTYAWHNHDKSSHRGIVRVFDPKNPMISIDKTKKELRETRNRFLAMLDPKDDSSISHMINTLEADTKLSRNCHDMAHDLGHRAYELYGFSRAMTYGSWTENTSVDDICAWWYMHGILEELFLYRPELQQYPEKVCIWVWEEFQWSCYHGVGHGIMFTVKRDVPKALNSCRTMHNQTSVYRCFEWVWMEMFWWDTGHSGAGSLGWDPEQPFEKCRTANADEKPTCFLYAHLGYLRYNPWDFDGVIRFCTANNLAPTDQNFCLKWIGITMMKHFTSNHLDRTEKLTKTLSYNQTYAYYEGVIGYSLLSSMPRKNLQEFCSFLKTDGLICQKVLSTMK